MSQRNIVILAAGKGKRMLSARPKVLHEVMGKPMLHYVVEEAGKLSPSSIVVVTGHEKALVEARFQGAGVLFAEQKEQKGTAHALLAAEDMLGDGDVLVLYGDVPLISAATLRAFLAVFEASDGVAFMTTEVNNPDGYGRVIMEGEEIREINTGICMLRRAMLPLAKEIGVENAKGEYYLTDICKVAGARGIRVRGFHHADAREVLGINTRRDLLEANRIMRERICERHMEQGVTLLGESIYIEPDVRIGKDTKIFPFSHLRGATRVGERGSIGPHAVLKDAALGDDVTVEPFCSLDGVTIESGARIAPASIMTSDAADGGPRATRVKQKHARGGTRRTE